MARNTKFDNIDEIMGSAAMSESDKDIIDTRNILEIQISKITDNPFQPRLEMKNDDLVALANSIQENGLLQPILLNKLSANKYEVVAGHRRVAAHKLLKNKTIKAIVISNIDSTDEEYEKIMAINALIENLQRQDLDILETAIAFQNLLNKKIYNTKDQLAKATGKTNVYVSKILSVLKLDKMIIEDLEKNKTIKDMEILYELQKILDSEIQLKIYEEIVRGRLTRAELREYNKRNITIPVQKTKQKNNNIFRIECKKNNTTIKFSTENLTENQKIKINEEFETILKKYF